MKRPLRAHLKKGDAEAAEASKVLALDVRRNLGWPDSRIMDSEDRRLQLARVSAGLTPSNCGGVTHE